MFNAVKPLVSSAHARRVIGASLTALCSLAVSPTQAMDTDIFTAQSTPGAAPNVLIILDNTANWAKASQKFPNYPQQGLAEIGAIQSVLASLPAGSSLNVGLMEFVGAGTPDGGYVRQAIVPMGPGQGSTATANLSAFNSMLSGIVPNAPAEKRDANTSYGDLMYNAYLYFSGGGPYANPSPVSSSPVDPKAYTANYSNYSAPLSAATNCGYSYIIFIGNPDQRGPTADGAANTSALAALEGVSSSALTRPMLPVYITNSSGIDVPTGTFVADTAPYNANEWSRFMHSTGIPVGSGSDRSYQTVTTYTIDVYSAQPNTVESSLYASMARAGGGKYFSATSIQQIISSLQSIFAEIQATNTTFASAALPISATNRSINSNQVYIGMFRPDPSDHPRWFGNLKRYQLGNFAGNTDLADVNGNDAVSSTTGFVTPCAVSWWTTDSGSYWYDVVNVQPRIFITQATTPGTAWQSAGDDSSFAKGLCSSGNPYSDTPDGGTVEKGAAAEMLRNQVGRNMLTQPSSGVLTLKSFNTSNVTAISGNSAINNNIVNFTVGQDVTGEIAGVASTKVRPSVHGDVIHSRPLPVDYGGSTGVVVYYGAGDGAYRGVAGNTGAELWSFIAPETYAGLERLLDNQPLIQTPYPPPPGQSAISGTTPKQFFFDGSTGLYQNGDNSKVWIYPAMRRGGRMISAFDVTNPSSPALKWRVGCPDLGDNTGCTSGMSGIGQTWSTPAVVMLSGYSSTTPVVVVGGGYDGCEDADTKTPSCTNPNGAIIYVLDANTGNVIKSFTMSGMRSVVADIALVDINQDGYVDAAYAVDTGGNIYRVDFTTSSGNYAPGSVSQWRMSKVAYTNVTPSNSYRKFEFAPAVLPYRNTVYLALSSGDREHPLAASYPYTTPVLNRFYVYLDDPSRSTATDLDGMQMISASSPTCTSPGILPGGSSYGWHMDLNYGTGEQGVTAAVIIGGMAAFSTNRPVTGSAASCTTSLGEARGYWVNLLNGSGAVGVSGACGGQNSATFLGGGLPPSPVTGVVTVNGQTQVVVIGAVQRDLTTATASISSQQLRPPISTKRSRVYWRNNSDTQ